MRQAMLTLAVLLGLAGSGPAQSPAKLDLRVLYVGVSTTPRGKAYTQFLQKHFRQAEATERKGFDPRQASAVDVVLLDWSQSERPEKPMSPLVLGPFRSGSRNRADLAWLHAT
jgi:hypothetical protein